MNFFHNTAFASFALLALAAGATAQSLSQGGKGGIEIEADDGIEWVRNPDGGSGQYHARGNAHASQNDVDLYADELTAYYRTQNESQEVFRMDAIGQVRVHQAETQAFGDKGVYHMDKQVVVLVGESLRLINPQATITAEDSLEYWQARSIAVARGKATVAQEDRRLRAGVLTAFIQNNTKTGKDEIQRIDATGGVHISSPDEIVTGREGVYEVAKQIATVCGDVKITRGENQLNGECAEVNMATGRSRIVGGAGRVTGLLLNSKKNN
ncbi:LptA/OstA family protein [Aestuariispira insulae]|uniref:Lipopolysaccharide export system protein LptA n=1 Tax=Aestuariispira insulae TaxID=1461337 RepID=A0A3D9H9P5_9PROT|nr:LptA/OstA family protein [Aestuariispira insulae]RED46199.1 lipopolysaccharide export system protein LptA [Aestuariispira insulae]